MKKSRTFANRFYQFAITILGFGSTMMFMACYAPPPSELQYMDSDEEVLDSVAEAGADDVQAVDTLL
ncbi:MAG: hypothetical protein IJV45_10270 [Prevotella sp.]|nr:hypothetical protein [Prevotella sp.]